MQNKHLQTLSQLHGVSGDESLVREYLSSNFKKNKLEITSDKLGSIIGSTKDKGPTVSLVAHMDEVGMIVSFIDESGLIYFNTIGSWFSQSMLNHRVKIKINNGDTHLGVIGSASPHALPQGTKTKIEIADMFIDIGCDNRKQVEALGVELGNFICPVGEYNQIGNKVLSKALDDRAGCALLLDIQPEVQNKQIGINYIGTVQEEVGLRGAQTSSTLVETDIAIILDVTICGDTPNVDSRKFQTNMNEGPSICLFDKRTIPNQKLLSYVKKIAMQYEIPVQYYTMQTGATDGGRFNVMAGGSAVLSIALPSRYVHANNSMISIEDYKNMKELIVSVVNDLTPELIEEILSFV